jgi:hypothetical protein
MPARVKERAQEQAREQLVKAAADIGRQLAQKREQVVQGLAQMDNRHPAEVRRLNAQQTRLLAGRDQAERGKLEPLLRSQRERLETVQKAERELVERALDVTAKAMERAPEQTREATTKAALEAIDQALKALEPLRKDLDRACREEQAEIREVQAERDRNRDPGLDAGRLDPLARDQRAETKLLARDIAVAKAELDHREVAERNRLDDQRLQRLREVTAEAKLSDEAIQRAANEAVCPGRRELSLRDEKAREAAVQRVKGQLAEEFAARLAEEVIAAERKRDPSRNLEFIAGDRIRDEKRQKLTDGVIAWRDHQGTLRVLEALEVKAGREAARELNSKVEKLGREAQEEIRRYARDLARDEIEQRLTTEQRTPKEWNRALKDARARHEAELRSPQAQREAGQVRQTQERLDLSARMYLDGRADRMTVDRQRELKDLVRAVVPEDVKEEQARKLAIDSRRLEEMARSIVDELRRRREEREAEV